MADHIDSKIEEIIKSIPTKKNISDLFLKRISEGLLTRDENSTSHFCIYFAGYDPNIKEVFIGHHIKSGLWLFNGGHIDKGESPNQALYREIAEEWGDNVQLGKNYK